MEDTYERLCLKVQLLEAKSCNLRLDLRETERLLFEARYAQVEAEIKGSMPEEIAALLPENNRKHFTVYNRFMPVHRLLLNWIYYANLYSKKEDLGFWLGVMAELAWKHCRVFEDRQSLYEQEVRDIEKSLNY